MSKPKVISLFQTEQYENRFLNVSIIGRAVDLFVECLSYDIEIPVNVTKERELDIFEEAILHMIKLKKCSSENLSSILCLEKDLVRFIIIRLIENGLLDDERSISQKGLQLLNYQSKLKKEVEYVYGKIFVIKQTGLILPYIHVGEFQSESVDDSNASTITIGFGSAGKYHTIKGKRIKSTNYENAQKSLSTTVVKKAINTFNHIAANRAQAQISLSNEYGLRNSQGGNIYFHMKAAVQEGNVDSLIISDGFVPNINGILDYFQKYHTEIVSNVKSKAIVMDVAADTSRHSINSHEKKYKEVYHYYEYAKENIPDINYEKTSKDIRDKINEQKKQVIINCYYSIEWCLYYHLKSHPVSESLLGLLKKRSVHINSETIMELAKKMGIRNVERYRSLFMHINGNKIEGVFKYASPELYVCLPLAIAEASENSSSSFHSVIHDDRNILYFMNILNQSALRHDTDAEAIEIDAAEILQKTEKIINTLIPDFIVSDSFQSPSIDNVSQLKLIGQISLEKALGSLLYYSMSEGLKNEWLKVSPDKKGCNLPDLREYIEVLYRILQGELKKANSELIEKKMYSQNDAEKICTSRYTNKLPNSFSKIKLINYSRALKNEGSTLGAEALVYYSSIEDLYVDQLNKHGFVELVDRIISLRGHSDLLVLNESEASLNSLRDKTIAISKLIGGYYE